jgi:hypothetical protein
MNTPDSGTLAQIWPLQTTWHSMPVYISRKKTMKAVQIVKQLEEDKIIIVDSVEKFTVLVEKIAKLL